MPSRRWRARSVPSRQAAAIAAAVLVSGALFCARPLGLADAVANSPAQFPALSVPFLTAYALGFEAGITAGLAGSVLLIAALDTLTGGPFSVVPLMLILGPWIAGRIVGSRRRLTRQLQARNDELLAQQDAYAAETVRYERSRIAADLHDVVGHALSLMVVQASAGQRAAQARGSDAGNSAASARQALEVVAETAREAQAEVGLLAGLLAGEQVAGDEAPAAQTGHPQPGPAPGARARPDLMAELVRQARAAGLDVTCQLAAEDGGRVDAASSEVVSRIVTEALTNALKHAPGAAVTVDVRAADGWLSVTVGNGAARQARDDLARAGGGYGLAGMRDRVLAHGGRFDAGPAGDEGWQVHATWPKQPPIAGASQAPLTLAP
jgi:signal transduction histidine kinase